MPRKKLLPRPQAGGCGMTQQTDEYDDFFRDAETVPPDTLGLLPCLPIEIASYWWRCSVCKQKHIPGSLMVWISMDIQPGATAEAVKEANADHAAPWCVGCARTLGGGAEGT
jgi:hypothetical protein